MPGTDLQIYGKQSMCSIFTKLHPFSMATLPLFICYQESTDKLGLQQLIFLATSPLLSHPSQVDAKGPCDCFVLFVSLRFRLFGSFKASETGWCCCPSQTSQAVFALEFSVDSPALLCLFSPAACYSYPE